MIDIQIKALCCGCTACANICPQSCITMQPDFEGFLYPQVDEKDCIDCGLCKKVCPSLSGSDKNPIQATYAVRHTVNDVLDNSTSGGAFTALAQDALAQGGVVFGVGFSDDFRVIHMEVQGNPSALSIFRGSKYVQSTLGDTFQRVSRHLADDCFVLFSGTPCQVSGLKNYIGHDNPKLLTVEVICRGTPSPLLWDTYLNYQSDRYRSKPTAISFRKKTYGYHSGTMEILFENGTRYTGSARIDYMLKSYYSGIASRPSCYACPCKGVARAADISIFDCWHADSLVPNLQDDNRGYTNIFLNTAKSLAAFKSASSHLEHHLIDTQKAIDMDGVMICNFPPRHSERGLYYENLCSAGIKRSVATFLPVGLIDVLIERSKAALYRLGLLQTLKKLKKE